MVDQVLAVFGVLEVQAVTFQVAQLGEDQAAECPVAYEAYYRKAKEEKGQEVQLVAAADELVAVVEVPAYEVAQFLAQDMVVGAEEICCRPDLLVALGLQQLGADVGRV